jgi:alkanesulfonate monooxygenase SsuD/methylene tetrahydromethanopterin reductase-like flavin-dependent oxidoreductase (luciferase family)
MRIAIGLPATIPGARGDLVLEWARKADAGPFSSLGILDRLVYTNYEPLIALAGAAAVTTRVRLMTTVLLAPLRSAALLAKQAATIDAISNGRLTLGLGIGGREDDFHAAHVDFRRRGKIFDAQLETMSNIWSGERLSDEIGAIGPKPAQLGGPEILIGGYTPAAIQRLARWGAGYISGGGAPEQAKASYAAALDAWTQAGRPGKPRFVGASYFGLGTNAAERGAVYLRDYYGFMGPYAERVAAGFPSAAEAVRATIKAFEDAGADEVVLWPTIAELDQVDRLAELASLA